MRPTADLPPQGGAPQGGLPQGDHPAHPLPRRRVLATGAALAAAALAAPLPLRALGQEVTAGAALPLPEGPTILTVRGRIQTRNTPDAAVFDDAMLGELPQRSFRTSTIWTPQRFEFSGPALRDVIERVGGHGPRLIAEAANRYRIGFDLDMLEAGAPIVARRIEGRPFGLRERGPLWIMFPFDSTPRFRTEQVYAQCIWHLVSLTLPGTPAPAAGRPPA